MAQGDHEIREIKIKRVSLLRDKQPANRRRVLLTKEEDMADNDPIVATLKFEPGSPMAALVVKAAETGKGEGKDPSFVAIAKAEEDKTITADQADAARGSLRMIKSCDGIKALSIALLKDDHGLPPGLFGTPTEEEKKAAEEKAKKAKAKKAADQMEKSMPIKFITKATGGLDFDEMKTPEGHRALVEQLYKAHLDSEASSILAKAQGEQIEKMARENIKKSCDEAAEKLTHVGDRSNLSELLVKARGAGNYKEILEALTKADVVAAKGMKALKETGSNLSDSTSGVEEQIEKMAMELMKSSDGLTIAQAKVRILETKEGQELYEQYNQERR